jgi:hypothetical protein
MSPSWRLHPWPRTDGHKPTVGILVGTVNPPHPQTGVSALLRPFLPMFAPGKAILWPRVPIVSRSALITPCRRIPLEFP